MFSLSLSSETELTMPWVTAGVISGETLTTAIQAPGTTSPASPIARGGRPLSLARTTARWVSGSNPRNSASIFRPSPVTTEIFSSRGEMRAVVRMRPSLSMTTPVAILRVPFRASTRTTDG